MPSTQKKDYSLEFFVKLVYGFVCKKHNT